MSLHHLKTISNFSVFSKAWNLWKSSTFTVYFRARFINSISWRENWDQQCSHSVSLVKPAPGVISTWIVCALSRLDCLLLCRWQPELMFTAHQCQLWECVCTRSPAEKRASDPDCGHCGAGRRWEEPHPRFTSASCSCRYPEWQTHHCCCFHSNQLC